MGFLHIGHYGPLFSGCEMSITFFIDWDPVDSYREPSRRREGVSSYWGSVDSCLGLCVGGVSSYWVFLDAYLWPWYVFSVLYRMGSGGLIFEAVTLQPKQRTVF